MNPIGIIFIIIGLFAFAGGLFDWDWFMNHSKARFFVRIIGRTGARIFYCILGLGSTTVGILAIYNIIDTSK